MDKIKDFIKRKSLKKSFAIYISSCILCALLLSLMLSWSCQLGQNYIDKKHINMSEYGVSFNEEKNHKIQYSQSDITQYTSAELFIYDLLGMLSVGIPIGCFIIAIIITSILFYKKNLQQPLIILNDAAEKIAENNLDFKIIYDKEDELGKLCLSFEKMRVALQDNNFEMWRQVEERKRLNAAFAHDLRTPLTVLKGQSEMLTQYTPKMSENKIISTAEMMKRHIVRLETYVNTMNDLQRLEDVEIKKEFIAVKDIEKQMRFTGMTVCTEKGFVFRQNIPNTQNVTIDVSVVMQVYENLLSNARRYADTKIEVSVEEQDSLFILSITDDGVGFTSKDLSNAMKAFYKAENETNNEHFGMGLNICKILCEKHGGYLKISNNNGAKVVAAFKE